MTRDHIDAVIAAHATLLELVDGLDDGAARRPSLLPEWSVGHVLTHLARNADSFVGLCEGAAQGEIRDQYPGGPTQRAADIAAGADRPAAELVEDLRTSCQSVEAAFAAITDWDAPCRVTQGLVTLRRLPLARCREVEMHASDLGFDAFTWHEWSDALVDTELAGLDADRRRQLVAFLAGRTDAAPRLFR